MLAQLVLRRVTHATTICTIIFSRQTVTDWNFRTLLCEPGLIATDLLGLTLIELLLGN